MSWQILALVTVLTFFGFHLVHYVGHRWLVHRPVLWISYAAHALGHHRIYTARDYASPRFVAFRATLLADFLVGGTVIGVLSSVLPWPLVLWITAESLVISGCVALIHRSFHVERHWIKRLPLFRTYDRLHVEHHRCARKNYGILFHGFDRLFGTYEKAKLAP